MTLFDKTILNIKRDSELVAEGNHLFIDHEQYFPRLSKYVPGYLKGDNIIITGSSGIGKSRLARYMFVDIPTAIAKNSNIKVKIFYNSLEESKEKFAATFVLKYLKEQHNISMSFRELMFPKVNQPHSPDVIAAIDAGWEYYRELEKYIEVVSIPNPLRMYLHVRDYLATVGTFYLINRDTEGNETSRKAVSVGDKWNHYEYHDLNHFIFLISDNINNYGAIKGKSWYDSIKDFSSKYCRIYLNLLCGVITVQIHQQAADKERVEGNFKAATIEQKLAPDLSGLGDIKITARDATIILGLFSPSRYKMILNYGGWDMSKIGKNFRSLHILKNREGQSDKIIPLGVHWDSDTFTELPAMDSSNNNLTAEIAAAYREFSG